MSSKILYLIFVIFICIPSTLLVTKNFTDIVSNEAVNRKWFVNCGQSFGDYRIVNGIRLGQNSQPWIARLTLRYSDDLLCGGSLITAKHILTAAHCIASIHPKRIYIILGKTDFCLNYDKGFEVHRDVEKIYKHENYNTYTLHHDIAIIKMNEKVPISKSIKPILLPYTSENFINELSLAIGWGAVEESGPLSCDLLFVRIPVISNQRCQKLYFESKITSNQICTLYDGKLPQDACQGDSGGPLIYVKNNKHIQIGIVSWGYGCARSEQPGVYTRVSSYIDWIQNIIRNDQICNFIKI